MLAGMAHMARATAHLFADEGARVAVTDLDQAKVDGVGRRDPGRRG